MDTCIIVVILFHYIDFIMVSIAEYVNPKVAILLFRRSTRQTMTYNECIIVKIYFRNDFVSQIPLLQFFHIVNDMVNRPTSMVRVLFSIHIEICFQNISVDIGRWQRLIEESLHLVADGYGGDDGVVL